MIKPKFSTFLLLATLLGSASFAFSQVTLPNPVLVFGGQTIVQVSGKPTVRYNYFVFNAEAYPGALFAAAPALPPCGANKNSARTWVDIFDQRGKRLHGFCALGSGRDLDKIWFSLGPDEVPPSWIYIEMNDRQTNVKYKSNLAETVL